MSFNGSDSDLWCSRHKLTQGAGMESIAMLVLVLLAAAAAYPTPPERTPEQIQHMVEVKARAKAASAAATPEVGRASESPQLWAPGAVLPRLLRVSRCVARLLPSDSGAACRGAAKPLPERSTGGRAGACRFEKSRHCVSIASIWCRMHELRAPYLNTLS